MSNLGLKLGLYHKYDKEKSEWNRENRFVKLNTCDHSTCKWSFKLVWVFYNIKGVMGYGSTFFGNICVVSKKKFFWCTSFEIRMLHFAIGLNREK